MRHEERSRWPAPVLTLRLRRLRALRQSQRRLAYQGLLIGVCVVAFVVAGSLALTTSSPTGGVFILGVATCMVMVAAYFLTQWGRVPATALLVFPTAWLMGLLAISVRVGPVASNFVGLTVLAFLFGGITQRRWRTLWLLIPATPTWLEMVLQTGGATSLWMRFPIVLALWISACELVAHRTQTMDSEVRRLSRAADVDDLTGLASRRTLTAALSAAHPGDALALIDIDHFKSINDEHGHSTGDVVLADFGRMLRRCIRFTDEAIRYGGEEILVVMREPGAAGIRRFDEQLRTEVLNIHPAVTYSAGVAVIASDETARDALERADQLLYDVKHTDRNRTAGIRTDPGTSPTDPDTAVG